MYNAMRKVESEVGAVKNLICYRGVCIVKTALNQI